MARQGALMLDDTSQNEVLMRNTLMNINLLYREREQRLAARNEALQTAAEQLQLKIKQKVTTPDILIFHRLYMLNF